MAQMSMKQGFKEFGDAGVEAVHQEMKQIHNCIVPIHVDSTICILAVRELH